MRRSLLLGGLLCLCACTQRLIEPDGTFSATVRGVPIVYRVVGPGTLAQATGIQDVGGFAQGAAGQPCLVQLDAGVLLAGDYTRAHTVAHEVGHCLQFYFDLPGRPRPDLGPYYEDPREGFAESYAFDYQAACGDSLAPLGWPDDRRPDCDEAPAPEVGP